MNLPIASLSKISLAYGREVKFTSVTAMHYSTHLHDSF